MNSPFYLGTIILAAGASSRMGRPKMLLPWGKATVLGHLLGQWQRIGAAQIVVVCASQDGAIHAELDRVGFPTEQRIENAEPSRGMFSSIQCAGCWPSWKSELTHWAISLGDQPHLLDETIRSIAEFSANHPDAICQPTRSERPRHPVFLPKRVFEKLARSNEPNLKEFLRAHAAEIRLVRVNDPGLDLDLDTPADYEKVQQLLTATARS